MINIKEYGGLNIKDLDFLGSGTQGKVYKINSEQCIKIFKRKASCKDELKTLEMAQGDSHFPKLYDYGESYIIREYIDGIELDKYLLSYPLTPIISYEIIQLYEAMISLGFRRLDSAIFHIFVTSSDNLKLIDTAKALKKKAIYPKLIIEGLRKLGYKEEFLDFVKTIRPELYVKWLHHI